MIGFLRAALAAGLVIAAALVFHLTSKARGLPQEVLAQLPQGSAEKGEIWFWAGGCASCHAAEKAEGEEKLLLGGGLVLKTEFGDFVVPNISMHSADGIGGWSAADFANAMLRGISPDGRHYYPSFPYASFARMDPGDITDLWAYMQTLPEVEGRAPDHDLKFPFTIRRGLGPWKLAFLDDAPVIAAAADDPQVLRGQYLVEGPGHCGECHTPRNFAGASELGSWLGGAAAAEGEGKVPNITGGEGGLGDWSVADIAYYLESGFTPEFDSVGGTMVEVQENMAMLEASDREAIAAYLKVVPPVDTVE